MLAAAAEDQDADVGLRRVAEPMAKDPRGPDKPVAPMTEEPRFSRRKERGRDRERVRARERGEVGKGRAARE